MTHFSTLSEMIALQPSEAVAMTAPAGMAFTYGGLHQLILRTGATLNTLGIGRGDRVAIVLPNCQLYYSSAFQAYYQNNDNIETG